MIASRLWPHFALQARYGCAFQHRAVSCAPSMPRTGGQGRVAATVASMQRSGIEGRRGTATTVSATHATTAGDGSWCRSRGRCAATIGEGGMVAGVGVVCPAARGATARRVSRRLVQKNAMDFGSNRGAKRSHSKLWRALATKSRAKRRAFLYQEERITALGLSGFAVLPTEATPRARTIWRAPSIPLRCIEATLDEATSRARTI